MEWIAYKLSVKVLYEKPVADEYFQMKCLPRIDETQKIVELKEEIRPRDCMVKKRMDDAKTSTYSDIWQKHIQKSLMRQKELFRSRNITGNRNHGRCFTESPLLIQR